MMRAGLLLLLCLSRCATAQEPLVLELDMERDLLSMAHNIDNFLFERTFSFSKESVGDLHERFERSELRDYLVATALVRIDGELAGMATEQEYVYRDAETGMPRARSAWIIMLNRPGMSGFLAVEQTEDASAVFRRAQQVRQDPDADWPDEFEQFLSTDSDARLAMATDDLSAYAGGRFEEYNMLNPADFSRLGYFRAGIRFVIHPPN